ncbi:hypothetical protein K2173_014729 [Erythroxylum novogranatense]|uniref:Uncharacterized protein n=1 Tax=Erythroxylum novogranatense TaxID=1862640 RepID=A0AAV8TFE2_9ROSI|nr:hypothetical protein K2173_014729 [Erythroxylum novogranatense]
MLVGWATVNRHKATSFIYRSGESVIQVSVAVHVNEIESFFQLFGENLCCLDLWIFGALRFLLDLAN